MLKILHTGKEIGITFRFVATEDYITFSVLYHMIDQITTIFELHTRSTLAG